MPIMQNQTRDKTHQKSALSPFHPGEQNIQDRVGKRAVMESFGQRAIRPYIPEQHREFYQQLPFIVAGSVDQQGWPWASILSGYPGFITSPDSTTLTINASAIAGDPIAPQLRNDGSPLGLLGIEMHSRRRNRVNGRVHKISPTHFSISVDQSFGNCPQYIQSRSIEFNKQSHVTNPASNIEEFTVLSHDVSKIIRDADTFFVSSYVPAKEHPEHEGVDISHRGGRPGFVKVDGNTLTIPDYSGNNFFNTLGNFLVNPKAGLVFIDFSTGDLFMLTGTVELLWEDTPEVSAFKGAERAWRFTLSHGVTLRNALPFRASFTAYSPNTLMAGDWEQAHASLAAEATRESWLSYTVKRIENESSVIRSFYLEPKDNTPLVSSKAGQFLTVRLTPPNANTAVIRTYTVSSTPDDMYYRISVKREANGTISQCLHDNVRIGDVIEARAPSGNFYIDAAEKRPAVLIGAGVGITPMISMTSHILNEAERTRHLRPLTILHAAKTTQQRAFTQNFRDAEIKSNGKIRYYSIITQPSEQEKIGIDFNAIDHITADTLRQILALDDYDFYLCGPPAFMQALYDEIRSLGVRDARIFAEALGPAALIRQIDNESMLLEEKMLLEAKKSLAAENEANEAVIKFVKSGFEQRWNANDATLLETAENHGLTPNFSCRNGTCGTCAVRLLKGSITYRTKPVVTPTEGEVLLCCAVPKKQSSHSNLNEISIVEIDL
jgi:ferredoxin-NADP reductase/predicted pyridoxine 5'-phosphate oxidase superfamily flavin-nucleotide-binding protein